MPSIFPDWYCIVNPHAGSGKTMPQWAIAEKILTASSVPYKTTLTNYKFHAEKLAYEAAQRGYRRFLAVGGDGSVHEVMNGIVRYTEETGAAPEDFTLSVIPIGSGNDWIKSLGIPHDTRAAAVGLSQHHLEVFRLLLGNIDRVGIQLLEHRVDARPLDPADRQRVHVGAVQLLEDGVPDLGPFAQFETFCLCGNGRRAQKERRREYHDSFHTQLA